ncbi:hypothetical protein RB653_008773 [Dictyostelium firmibasis]|uniref:Uncharacterized protein n=1 Tax=Dictyostelium firmibasis TaxID=79012 RepID=A0AAN7YPJ9_9MYCE
MNGHQIFKERNHYYIRICEGYVLPLLLILHDYNNFSNIQFLELITVLQGIIKNHFKNGGMGLASTYIPPESASTSKPLYLSDIGFTIRFAPTYPRYSVMVKNIKPQKNRNEPIKIKRKETIYIDDNYNNIDRNKHRNKDNNIDKNKHRNKDNKNQKEDDLINDELVEVMEEEKEKEEEGEEEEKEKEKEKEEEDNDSHTDKNEINKKRSITTITTTISPTKINKKDDNLEIIETRFDKQKKEEEVDIDVLNDRAIALAATQEEGFDDDVVFIKDGCNDNKNKNENENEINECDDDNEEEPPYQGGMYKGLHVTGHTMIVETQIKVAGATTLISQFRATNEDKDDDNEDDNDDEFDDFNLPDTESQTSPSSSKSKQKSPNVKKTTTTSSRKPRSKPKSKSTMATNNGGISLYFKK